MSDRLHGTESEVGDLGDRAFAWIKQRLTNSPIGVIGNKRILDAALADSINDHGLGIDTAWERFEQVVAPNNIGLDSERFLAFIPLSPSVATVWMDAIVSAANFSAESWLEGAGAVAAENQVIELLCSAAGMPPGAAGCFMSGGSIGNLSALAVARHRAADRRFVAVADTAHA
ncbi:MAG: aspartate aminotransferase family protein, partial [Ilumatobacteraceae bacterium]